MFCQKCGSELPESAIFCGSCGENQTISPQQAAPVYPPQSMPMYGQPQPMPIYRQPQPSKKSNNKIDSYIQKYNTPRVFQVFVTITSLWALLMMFTIQIMKIYNPFNWYGTSSTENVFGAFFHSFNYSVMVILEWFAVIAVIFCIVFIWVNRPKLSLATTGVLILIMVLSYIRNYDIESYWNYDKGSFITDSITSGIYWLWAFIGLIVAFEVLALLFTKKGARPPKVVQVNSYTTSSVSEIERYKYLLDGGIITQEEFDAKKKQLLGL